MIEGAEHSKTVDRENAIVTFACFGHLLLALDANTRKCSQFLPDSAIPLARHVTPALYSAVSILPYKVWPALDSRDWR